MTPLPFQAIQNAKPPREAPAGGSSALPRHDARWVLAARASLAASTPAQTDPAARERVREVLVAWAGRHGVAPVHARTIIAIAEAAAGRGGLGADDARRIAELPAPERAAVGGDRLGLFVTLAIPVLIAIAAAIAAARWL